MTEITLSMYDRVSIVKDETLEFGTDILDAFIGLMLSSGFQLNTVREAINDAYSKYEVSSNV